MGAEAASDAIDKVDLDFGVVTPWSYEDARHISMTNIFRILEAEDGRTTDMTVVGRVAQHLECSNAIGREPMRTTGTDHVNFWSVWKQ